MSLGNNLKSSWICCPFSLATIEDLRQCSLIKADTASGPLNYGGSMVYIDGHVIGIPNDKLIDVEL